jgi:subtilisin-like proprotein convertase family protein
VAAQAQTYTSTTTPVPILDLATAVDTINVPDLFVIGDLDVLIDITHTWDADLDIILIPPGGNSYVHLCSDVGGAGDNFIQTIFDQQAATLITAGVAPFNGSFRPEGGAIGWVGDFPLPGPPLADLDSLVGRASAGSWSLWVDDDTGADVGTINTWSLIFTAAGGPTNPIVEGGFAPFVGVNNCGTAVTLLTASVIPAANPTSTNLRVTADLTALGGSASTQLFDNGTNGDVTAGDNIFSLSYTVPATAVLGLSQPVFTVTDDEGRSSSDTGDITIVDCPTGACCTGSSCRPLTAPACAAAGGSYLGDNVPCVSNDRYVSTAGSQSLEDISATGNLLTLTDDSDVNVLIGFTFAFFGNTYSDCFVGSNGFISFGAGSIVFINTAIPTAALPNNVIYGLWDDLNPGVGGSVQYETRGTAGVDQRFIVQWTAVPQFGQTDSNTFQIILFENGSVDMRYGPCSAFTDADATVGIENADGTAATSVPGSSIADGVSYSWVYRAGDSACGPSCGWQADGCFADYNNDSGIDADDVIAFFADWDAGQSCADVDASGGVDSDDVILYFASWDLGGTGFPGC